MKVKHQPATPLPWHTIGERGVIVNDDASEVCFPIGPKDKREPNSDYIAHAANAYPKLVEALRALLDRFDATSIDAGFNPAVQHDYFNAARGSIVGRLKPEDFRSILLEIGEAS